jgi:hypothetical protein
MGEQEDWNDRSYRLYRFLTDVEDIVDRESSVSLLMADGAKFSDISPAIDRIRGHAFSRTGGNVQ